MTILVTNNGSTTLAANINNVVTSITVADGSVFPNPGADEFFYITLVNNAATREIVKCTSRSTNVLTVVRAQDGTTASAFTTADDTRVELRPVRAIHLNYAQLDTTNSFTTDQSVTGSVHITGAAAGAARNVKFETAGSERWRVGLDTEAESGSNAGSDFEFARYSDAGSLIDVPVTIDRSSGVVNFTEHPTWDGAPLSFASGIILPFRQASTPVGWTKDTTYNNAALRVVSGTPSQQTTAGNEFTTLLASRAIATANLPAHTHTISGTTSASGSHSHSISIRQASNIVAGGGGTNVLVNPSTGFSDGTATETTDTEAAHTHTFSDTSSSVGSGTAMNFDVNYVDLYLAQKN